MQIERASYSEDLYKDIMRLLPQLSRSASPSREFIASVLDNPDNYMFVARHNGRVIGMLTLVLFRIPTGVRTVIEDVVVDEEMRGHGVARELTERALRMAAVKHARTIDLTSRPERKAANRLYESIGFVLRDTNVWRYTL